MNFALHLKIINKKNSAITTLMIFLELQLTAFLNVLKENLQKIKRARSQKLPKSARATNLLVPEGNMILEMR